MPHPAFQPQRPEQPPCTAAAPVAVTTNGGRWPATRSHLSSLNTCTPAGAAAALHDAQQLASLLVNTTSSTRKGTPVWTTRRTPHFGVWVYPKLRLVLTACPKCGNTQVRSALSSLSRHAAPTPGTLRAARRLKDVGFRRADDESWAIPNAAVWRVRMADSAHKSGWDAGAHAMHNDGWDARVTRAFAHVQRLLRPRPHAHSAYKSLVLSRHPYSRLISGYSELESRWREQVEKGARDVMRAVQKRPFWSLPRGTPQRFAAWWADVVLGHLFTGPTPHGCLLPVHELYHVLPTVASFLRTWASENEYICADAFVDADEVSAQWPALLTAMGFNASDPVLNQLMVGRKNSWRGSTTSQVAYRRLATDGALRASVSAFYAQDFACLGYAEGVDRRGHLLFSRTSEKTKFLEDLRCRRSGH